MFLCEVVNTPQAVNKQIYKCIEEVRVGDDYVLSEVAIIYR